MECSTPLILASKSSNFWQSLGGVGLSVRVRWSRVAKTLSYTLSIVRSIRTGGTNCSITYPWNLFSYKPDMVQK